MTILNNEHKRIQTLIIKRDKVNNKIELLKSKYVEENSKYKVGTNISEYIVGDISFDEDMFDFVYFLYDKFENFVGYFSQQELENL